MIGWHKYEQTQRESEELGSSASCSSWGSRVRHDLAAEQQL